MGNILGSKQSEHLQPQANWFTAKGYKIDRDELFKPNPADETKLMRLKSTVRSNSVPDIPTLSATMSAQQLLAHRRRRRSTGDLQDLQVADSASQPLTRQLTSGHDGPKSFDPIARRQSLDVMGRRASIDYSDFMQKKTLMQGQRLASSSSQLDQTSQVLQTQQSSPVLQEKPFASTGGFDKSKLRSAFSQSMDASTMRRHSLNSAGGSSQPSEEMEPVSKVSYNSSPAIIKMKDMQNTEEFAAMNGSFSFKQGIRDVYQRRNSELAS